MRVAPGLGGGKAALSWRIEVARAEPRRASGKSRVVWVRRMPRMCLVAKVPGSWAEAKREAAQDAVAVEALAATICLEAEAIRNGGVDIVGYQRAQGTNGTPWKLFPLLPDALAHSQRG